METFDIHCITLNGDTVFSNDSPDLSDSRNIQIDDTDNIYVLGNGSQNVQKLTSSGTLEDILLKDSLYKPVAFCYCKNWSKVYIVYKEGLTILVSKSNK